MNKTIDYGARIIEATRMMLKNLLAEVARDGLPGGHYFLIKFDTTHPKVEIAKYLKANHPNEMTIVIQNWFENMAATSETLEITLNFANKKEPLVIPWQAITSFFDPSVDFALQFDQAEYDEQPTENQIDIATEENPTPAEVVQLDQFRKSQE